MPPWVRWREHGERRAVSRTQTRANSATHRGQACGNVGQSRCIALVDVPAVHDPRAGGGACGVQHCLEDVLDDHELADVEALAFARARADLADGLALEDGRGEPVELWHSEQHGGGNGLHARGRRGVRGRRHGRGCVGEHCGQMSLELICIKSAQIKPEQITGTNCKTQTRLNLRTSSVPGQSAKETSIKNK